MIWKIYYSDGTTYSDLDGPPEQAPALDVQVIVQLDDTGGRYNQMGSDYYIWREDRWWGVDIFGLFDWLIHNSSVKFGRTVDNEKYRMMFQMAENDPDFPVRSGFDKRLERNRPR